MMTAKWGGMLIAAAVLIAAGAVLAGSDPTAGPVFNPANGHWYEAVTVADAMYWDDAKSAAEERVHRGVRGHLATITSPQEQQFVVVRLPSAISGEFYLGGFQKPGAAEPRGGWQWVTGEPWDYVNWAGGEPNDANEGESRLAFMERSRGGGWNDVPASRFPVKGYVVEYETAAPVSTRPAPVRPAPVRAAPAKSRTAMLPDLVGAWRTLDQRTIGAGTSLKAVISGELVVRNSGRKPSPATRVRFLLALEPGLNVTRRRLLQEVRIPGLKPGKSATAKLSAPLPLGTDAAGQYLTAVVNPANAFPEATHQNNVTARRVP